MTTQLANKWERFTRKDHYRFFAEHGECRWTYRVGDWVGGPPHLPGLWKTDTGYWVLAVVNTPGAGFEVVCHGTLEQCVLAFNLMYGQQLEMPDE